MKNCLKCPFAVKLRAYRQVQLFKHRYKACSDLRRAHGDHSERDALAVVIAESEALYPVTYRVAEIQHPAEPGFLLVLTDNVGLQTERPDDDFFKVFCRVAVLKQREKVGIEGQRHLDRLRKPV